MYENIKKSRENINLAEEFSRDFAIIDKSKQTDLLSERIAQFTLLKKRSKSMEQFIFGCADFVEDKSHAEILRSIAQRMSSCCHTLLFRNYYKIEQVKLVRAITCKIPLLCPICAHNRAGRSVRKYLERLELILAENPRLKPIFITLTIKNGFELSERFEHLSTSFKTLCNRMRDANKKKRGYVEFNKIKGAVYSYEFTESDNGWHPHIHMIALVEDWIDRDKLIQEWQSITKDSYIVDVRRIKKQKLEYNGQTLNPYAKAFCEVFKYALKFSDLSHESNLLAYFTLKNRRLVDSFGLMRGIKIDDTITDDINDILADEPYLELLYKFSNSCYSVIAHKHIDPASTLVESA